MTEAQSSRSKACSNYAGGHPPKSYKEPSCQALPKHLSDSMLARPVLSIQMRGRSHTIMRTLSMFAVACVTAMPRMCIEAHARAYHCMQCQHALHVQRTCTGCSKTGIYAFERVQPRCRWPQAAAHPHERAISVVKG
eukprot:1979445-Pleurochrysis_carterae.AAC.2